MQIKFLGTGAADWPEKRTTETFFRRLSSTLIDGVLLIDPGPCVPDALEEYGISGIKYVLNTHRHSDHFNEDTLKMLVDNGAEFVEIPQGATIKVGKYNITALKGNHSTAEDCTHYIIDDGSKKIFYGLDGAWLLYAEYTAIREMGIDLAILDGTTGMEGDIRIFEHNDLNMVITMKKTLKEHVKRFMITHLARTLHKEHQLVVKDLAPHGIEVAYDGLEVEV